MTISARLRRLRLRISALLTICAMTLAVASCGQPDTRTVITVWSWEPSMTTLIADFEKANPDVRVKLNNISGYDHLNSAIQDGYGTPDVVQLEYYALPQYAVSGQLMDLTGRVGSYSSFFTPGTWASVQLAQRTYALPMDSVCHNKSGIRTRVDGGACPADTATLNSGEFLNKTTVTSEHHVEVEYFGGQRFNEVLSEAAESVSVGYQYLPFEVYARSHFRSATADAYTWSAAKQAYDRAKARKDAGLTNDDGGPITLPDRPGKKITLMSGIAAWQRDLKEYGVNQGFTIK